MNELLNILLAQYIKNVDQKKETKVKNVNLNEILFILMIFSTFRFTRNEWKKKINRFRIVQHAKKEWKKKLIENTTESSYELKLKKKIIIMMTKNERRNKINWITRQRNLRILHVNKLIISSQKNWSNLRNKLFY